MSKPDPGAVPGGAGGQVPPDLGCLDGLMAVILLGMVVLAVYMVVSAVRW